MNSAFTAKPSERLANRGIYGQAGLLRLDLFLVVIPGADRGVNEAAKEKQEADEQYDAGHPRVKPMSFVHTRDLTHCVFPGHTLPGDTAIKAQRQERVNYAMCKNASI